MKRVKVVVVGAGVVGSSTAVCIAETLTNCSVTLMGDRFTPDTTSDIAAGILICAPFPDIPLERQQKWFKDTIDHLLTIAQSEEASDAGVLLSSGWQLHKSVPVDKKPFWSEFVLGFRTMTDQELKRFPNHKFGQAFTTVKCECSNYLPWLEKRFRKAGGQVVKQKVNNLQELSTQGYDVIVNCSGLGAKTLVEDSQVYPVRGQVLKVHAPWLQHFIRDGEGQSYIYPGMHSVTIGGTRQADDWRLEPDPGDSQNILERCSRLEPSLRRARVLGVSVGLRPSRKNVRLERELLLLGGRQVDVVHNYGHGGWGVTLSWGTALEALSLVRQCLYQRPPSSRL
ncbi:D-aspartate oxidase isoform X1 [Esox lucius]|nr:D-aspartate oxidase isoform X1 [Esox lucius]